MVIETLHISVGLKGVFFFTEIFTYCVICSNYRCVSTAGNFLPTAVCSYRSHDICRKPVHSILRKYRLDLEPRSVDNMLLSLFTFCPCERSAL